MARSSRSSASSTSVAAAWLGRSVARNPAIFALAVVTGVGLAVSGLAGCGPSLRRVEQANVYFERCHAADRDSRRTDMERRACWQAWRDHYEVGQPDDRTDYVRERLVMLDPASGDVLSMAAPESSAEPEGTEIASPALVEISSTIEGDTAAGVFAEPDGAPPEGPELSDTVSDRPPRARRRPTIPRTRTSACGNACEPSFVECASDCRVADRGCADACRHIFRQCSRGCF